MSWSTVSKAKVKSKCTTTQLPESMFKSISLKTKKRAESVLCSALKQDWKTSTKTSVFYRKSCLLTVKIRDLGPGTWSANELIARWLMDMVSVAFVTTLFVPSLLNKHIIIIKIEETWLKMVRTMGSRPCFFNQQMNYCMILETAT